MRRIIMSKKSGFGKFLAGAAIGAGLGILFAPKKGSETRADLKAKIDDLVKQVKKIDLEEVKEEFEVKLENLKAELADLDKEKVLEIAKEKALELKDKAQDLVDLAIEKGTPILRDMAEEVRLKTIDVTKEVLKKLENAERK
jgi:gas vesicle protein